MTSRLKKLEAADTGLSGRSLEIALELARELPPETPQAHPQPLSVSSDVRQQAAVPRDGWVGGAGRWFSRAS